MIAKQTPKYSKRQTRWTQTLIAVAIVVCVPVTWWTVTGYRAEMALRESASTLCAPVHDRQVVGRRREHHVRYHFEVDGQRYTHTDATGRHDLWAEVSEQEAQQTDAGGCISVVYLPDDPTVNRPASLAREMKLKRKVAG